MSQQGKPSDLAQIAMLTLYFCAVVFGLWGLWTVKQSGDLRNRRDQQEKSLTDLSRVLGLAESEQTILDFRRREESKKNAGNIASSIQEVINKMDGSASQPEIANYSTNEKPVGNKIKELEYQAVFKPKRRSDLLTFLQRLENEAPHLSFSKVKLENKARRSAEESSWVLSLTAVSYIGDETLE